MVSHKACESCEIIRHGLKCDASEIISGMAKDKGKSADFNYCVFNRMAKKLKLKILREELEIEPDIEYRRKTG